jgi:hypothetical protein
MSSINSIGAGPTLFQPIQTPQTPNKPGTTGAATPIAANTTTTAASTHDKDHDGDSDGPGIDVKG